MNDATTLEFLQALYPDPVRPGRLTVWIRSRKNGSQSPRWLPTLGQAATAAHRARGSRETFFSVPLHDQQAALELTRERRPKVRERAARACEDSAVALPALWAEIEVAGGLGRDAARRLLGTIAVPPSIIVDTGDSYQVYWILRHLWLLETAADRAAARAWLRRLQGALHAAAQAEGYPVAHGGDLAQLMRLPDTFNLERPDQHVVAVVHFPRVRTARAGAAGDHRYDLSDFADLPEAPRPPALECLLDGAPPPPAVLRPRPLEPIAGGCAWLDHWLRNARRLRGKDYEDVVAILRRCTAGGFDGRGLVYLASEQHPAHNPVTTEEQLVLARRADPPTCARIGGRRGVAETYCRQCPHFGLLDGPLDLGQPADAGAEDRFAAGRGAVGPVAGHAADPVPIEVTPREHEVNDQALAALAAGEPHLFDRCGVMVEVAADRVAADRVAADRVAADRVAADRVAAGRAQGSPRVRPIGESRMRELLARHCDFRAAPAGEATRSARSAATRPVHPPRWVARSLLARGCWPELPALAGLVECPVLRPGGTVLQRPGYDAESRLLYAPSGEFHEVPEAPGEALAHQALAEVREAVRDFPFPTEADRAAWLCALLTPLARAAFSGPSPLNLIEADVRGGGKSLLADVCSVLLTGRPAARTSLPGRAAEQRRTITSLALAAERTVLLDNVTVLGSPTLDRALTAELWRDRLPGSGRQTALPLDLTWYATGNGVSLATGTARRCLHIRLSRRGRVGGTSSSLERRADFLHPRLLAWLGRERRRLLPAAVTLLRAYVVAGRPAQQLAAWGCYQAWSELVRSTVVWLGLPDPASTCAASGAGVSDVAGDLVSGLAEVIHDLGRAAPASRILERLAEAPGAYSRLRSALAELFPGARELPSPIQLAGRLRSYRGRIVRGACIERAPKPAAVAHWTVRKAS